MSPSNKLRFLVLVTAAVAGAWLSFRMHAPVAQPGTATVLAAPEVLPEFSLLDQHGQPVGREVFYGHWSLLFFGFTNCPDICPTTLQVLAAAKRELAGQGFKTVPQIVLISVDPERDTPDIIGRYINHFGDDNLGITGNLEELRKLTDGLGIYFAKSPVAANTGNYSVDHSAVVLVINPRGQFQALFSTPHTIENFTDDLPIIMAGN